MAVKIAKTRNYEWPVPWAVGDTEDEMTATFYLPTESEFNQATQDKASKKPLLELVLKNIADLEISDAGKTLKTFKQLKPIILADEELSRAIYDAFMDMWVKKTQPETFLYQAHTIMGLMSDLQAQETGNPSAPD